jgi:hypothetical protein
MEAYGPDAFPTEDEIALVKPHLGRYIETINSLKPADVEELPYFRYLFDL